MPGGVFICYRREESAFAARAIHDRVVQRLERENVFLDVDNIDLGVDWFNVLSERLARATRLLRSLEGTGFPARTRTVCAGSTILTISSGSRLRLR